MNGEGNRLGTLLLIEGWGAPYAVLDDPARVREALEAAVTAGGLTLLRIELEHFTPHGITAVGLLAESHLAIHTWPEHGVFAADLFHCGTSPVPAVERELAMRLAASQWRRRMIERATGAPRTLLARTQGGETGS